MKQRTKEEQKNCTEPVIPGAIAKAEGAISLLKIDKAFLSLCVTVILKSTSLELSVLE